MPPAESNPPKHVRVRIEVSKGSHIKRGSRGEIDYLSPFPCPWNYGSAIDLMGADGDPLDVVVMGEKLKSGAVVEVELQGHIPFLDLGLKDDKWVGAPAALRSEEIDQLNRFFRRYAQAKRLVNRVRRRGGEIRAEPYHSWSE
jgi:inorganic pyrophosphatase